MKEEGVTRLLLENPWLKGEYDTSPESKGLEGTGVYKPEGL